MYLNSDDYTFDVSVKRIIFIPYSVYFSKQFNSIIKRSWILFSFDSVSINQKKEKKNKNGKRNTRIVQIIRAIIIEICEYVKWINNLRRLSFEFVIDNNYIWISFNY